MLAIALAGFALPHGDNLGPYELLFSSNACSCDCRLRLRQLAAPSAANRRTSARRGRHLQHVRMHALRHHLIKCHASVMTTSLAMHPIRRYYAMSWTCQFAPRARGSCRYLPTDSTMARFFWVIRLYARNGFFVMIDDHTEDPTFSQSPDTWLQVRCRNHSCCCMLVFGDHSGLPHQSARCSS